MLQSTHRNNIKRRRGGGGQEGWWGGKEERRRRRMRKTATAWHHSLAGGRNLWISLTWSLFLTVHSQPGTKSNAFHFPNGSGTHRFSLLLLPSPVYQVGDQRGARLKMVLSGLHPRRYREHAYGQRQGRGEKGWGKWREQHGCICTTVCKQPASGNLLHDSGNSHWSL